MQPNTEHLLNEMQHLVYEIRDYQAEAVQARKGTKMEARLTLDECAPWHLTEFLQAVLELQLSHANANESIAPASGEAKFASRMIDRVVTLSCGLTSTVGLSEEAQELVQKAIDLHRQHMPQA